MLIQLVEQSGDSLIGLKILDIIALDQFQKLQMKF